MDQQDKIGHLNELAHEHFNDGNLSAAINAWQQVLQLDSGNADAQRGVTLAKKKLAAQAPQAENPLGGGPFDEPSAADSGPFDADATMMFSPGASGGSPKASGAFDADSTMMFSPGSARAPAPAESDSDATMMFNPGASSALPLVDEDEDAGATMMFNPSAAAPLGDLDGEEATPPPMRASTSPSRPAPVAPPDSDATMMFNPGAVLKAVAPHVEEPPEEEHGDADATMMFSPGAMSLPAPSSGGLSPSFDFGLSPEPSLEAEADQTLLSPDDGGGFAFGGHSFAPPPSAPSTDDQTMLSPDSADDFALPPPPPPVASRPSAPAKSGGPAALEDFEMPSGGLEMGGPPMGGLGGLSLPNAPAAPGRSSGDTGGGGGFSFDLPPAAPAARPFSGSDFAVPDLPSLGPPSRGHGAPPPLAPPPPPSIPDFGGPQSSGQFGEVDPGEIEGLAVPTVAPAEEGAPLSEAERQAREKAKAAEFAQLYGDAPPVPAGGHGPLTMAPPPSAIPWKLLLPLGLVIALICGAVGVFLHLNKSEPPPVVTGEEVPKPVIEIKTPPEWKAEYEAEVVKLESALKAGSLDEAVSRAARAHECAGKAGLEDTSELARLSASLQFEQGWNAKFELALRSFCIEDYEAAAPMFDELVSSKPGDARPVEYVGRIYYNLGVQTLQSLEPTDAVWLFGQAIERLPEDDQAKELKAFAEAFPRGMNLVGVYEYTSKVDPLQFRKAGCN